MRVGQGAGVGRRLQDELWLGRLCRGGHEVNEANTHEFFGGESGGGSVCRAGVAHQRAAGRVGDWSEELAVHVQQKLEERGLVGAAARAAVNFVVFDVSGRVDVKDISRQKLDGHEHVVIVEVPAQNVTYFHSGKDTSRTAARRGAPAQRLKHGFRCRGWCHWGLRTTRREGCEVLEV